MQVEKKMKQILKDIGVHVDSRAMLEKLQLDSLQFAIFMMEIENEFDLSIDDMNSLDSFDQIAKYIETKICK